jgi:hypothetical protein
VTRRVPSVQASSLSHCLARTYVRFAVDRESAGRGAGGILPTSGDTLAPFYSHPVSSAPSFFTFLCGSTLTPREEDAPNELSFPLPWYAGGSLGMSGIAWHGGESLGISACPNVWYPPYSLYALLLGPGISGIPGITGITLYSLYVSLCLSIPSYLPL